MRCYAGGCQGAAGGSFAFPLVRLGPALCQAAAGATSVPSAGPAQSLGRPGDLPRRRGTASPKGRRMSVAGRLGRGRSQGGLRKEQLGRQRLTPPHTRQGRGAQVPGRILPGRYPGPHRGPACLAGRNPGRSPACRSRPRCQGRRPAAPRLSSRGVRVLLSMCQGPVPLSMCQELVPLSTWRVRVPLSMCREPVPLSMCQGPALLCARPELAPRSTRQGSVHRRQIPRGEPASRAARGVSTRLVRQVPWGMAGLRLLAGQGTPGRERRRYGHRSIARRLLPRSGSRGNLLPACKTDDLLRRLPGQRDL